MRKKNKLKKKISINIIVIVFVSIIAVITVGIGYSYWNTRLTISGRVRSVAEEVPLDISFSKVSGDKYKYASLNFSTTELTFLSDECNENVLTTHIKAENGFNSSLSVIGTSFKFANISDYTLTDGHVELVEFKDGNGVLENPRLLLSSPNILSYGSAMVNFSVDANKVEMTENAYCKFDITYKENDVTKHLYYIIDIIL